MAEYCKKCDQHFYPFDTLCKCFDKPLKNIDIAIIAVSIDLYKKQKALLREQDKEKKIDE